MISAQSPPWARAGTDLVLLFEQRLLVSGIQDPLAAVEGAAMASNFLYPIQDADFGIGSNQRERRPRREVGWSNRSGQSGCKWFRTLHHTNQIGWERVFR